MLLQLTQFEVDFNVARTLPSPPGAMSPSPTSLWSAAPEVLLGTCNYTTSQDIFSAGLVLAELLLSEPLLQADDPLGQLDSMVRSLGSPSRDDLDGLEKLDCFYLRTYAEEGLESGHAGNLDVKFDRREQGQETVRIIRGLLTWNPGKRWTATETLGTGEHNRVASAQAWWRSKPSPLDLEELSRTSNHDVKD
ncbi:MAG: Cyclin-dependent kinase 10 [Stictis urceolatum]|nr:Cyclin-dependent kinase 10 [Stictis urceolata]